VEGKRILAPLLITLVALSGFLAGYQIGQPAATENAEPNIQIIPIVRVYHNGELAYEKVGDPPTNNLALLFMLTVMPKTKVDGTGATVALTNMLGSAWNGDPDVQYYIDEHTAWIVLGTGTTPPAPTDATMQAVAAGEAKLVNMWFDENTTAWHMVISAGVQLANAYNITEIGWAVDVAYVAYAASIDDPMTSPGRNVLVFRDLLPQPIQAQAGDVIEVQYEIVIDLP